MRAIVIVACLAACSCSVLLDWSGYSGSDGGEAGEAGEAEASVPRCSAANCGGCCTAQGFCAGGESATTCGGGASACQDCRSKGQACKAGSCVAPPPDAAPAPPCSVSRCTQFLQCIPAIQSGCCKPDNTCGCAYVPAPGVPPGCN